MNTIRTLTITQNQQSLTYNGRSIRAKTSVFAEYQVSALRIPASQIEYRKAEPTGKALTENDEWAPSCQNECNVLCAKRCKRVPLLGNVNQYRKCHEDLDEKEHPGIQNQNSLAWVRRRTHPWNKTSRQIRGTIFFCCPVICDRRDISAR